MLSALPALLAVALFVAAAASDVWRFLIPNGISLALLALLPVAWAVGFPVAPLGAAAAGALVFAVTFGLWTLGRFGGGDVKLLSAAAVWAGLDGLANLLLVTTLVGGLLAAVLLAARRLPEGCKVRRSAWLTSLFDERGVPYGVAIASGAILVVLDGLARMPR